MTEISFTTTREEFDTITKIVDRAIGLRIYPATNRMAAHMDLAATHANGCPMDFHRLLAADDGNFAHDVGWIAAHLDRETGKLGDHFLPRFHKHEPFAA